MSRPSGRRSTLDTRMRSSRTPSCGSQPANISLTARRQRHAHHTDSARKQRGAVGGSSPAAPPLALLTNSSTYQMYPIELADEVYTWGRDISAEVDPRVELQILATLANP